MRTQKKSVRLAAVLLLTATLLTGLMPAAAAVSFTDVNPGDWFYDPVMACAELGIINGMGDGTYAPNSNLKTGEFITLMANACCASEGTVIYDTSAPVTGHWAEPCWRVVRDAGILEVPNYSETTSTGEQYLVECSEAEFESYITRYDMAVLLRNLVFNYFNEEPVELEDAASHIGDYASIPAKYISAVEQSYGKGILCGMDESGSFYGNELLTRAQAARVIAAATWPSKRRDISFAEEVTPPEGGGSGVGSGTYDPSTSFSWRYRNMTTEQRRIALFGNANKTYFTSAADAAGYVVDLAISYWDLDSNGNWYVRNQTIQVNKVVRDEVAAMFTDLYNLPLAQRFPIYYVGSARYTDTMRHAWGCALDINANHNYYMVYGNPSSKVGQWCWRDSNSPYCIRPDSAIVNIFATYGWGWGGEGWTSSVDYMHFSILASGG